MAVSVEKKPSKKTAAAKSKLKIKRHFFRNENEPEASPYDTVEWGIRDAVAGDFEQKGVEAPVQWSDSAVGIVAKLYFATINGKRESSVKTLIQRVVTKITDEGIKHGYFDDGKEIGYEKSALIFENELAYILLHQIAAFNTPVWLNLGVPGRKQCCSACYLLNVEDTMFGEDSITEWWCNEAKIFKSGAGSGVNLSKIRGSMEKISHGGIASGPVSFMRPADANAGTVKSGSVARRAAKLVCLDVDHPDILDFIDSKVREDERMRTLMAAGVNLDPSTPEGEKNIAECTSFQNANISARLSDEFMRAVENEEMWDLNSRTGMKTGTDITDTVYASDLLNKIAEAAWKCADPGVMFDDTINSWHTTPSLGRINTANPCCETMLNDNTSCNLTSMNLVKFLNDDNSFRFDDFYQTVDIMITAMDITCSFSEHPTKKVEENTRNLRQLGLGYSNLGAALMIQGMPYDSDEGRDWAASVTSLMTGRAYGRSAELASSLGSFKHWDDNRDSMENVINKHVDGLPGWVDKDDSIWDRSAQQWNIIAQNHDNGFRNSQVTVIAPTGTISFMMDCDTTGAEPLYSPITYKKLASGGTMEQVPKCFNAAMEKYSDSKVFETAAGKSSISYQGHLNMVAAIQPHISGAISKTVNLPIDVTVDNIYNIYLDGWKKGIKCLSVYRDGSKATQVLSTKKDKTKNLPDYTSARLAAEAFAKFKPFAQNSPDEKNSSVLQFEAMGVGEKEDEAFKELETRYGLRQEESLDKEYTKFKEGSKISIDCVGEKPQVKKSRENRTPWSDKNSSPIEDISKEKNRLEKEYEKSRLSGNRRRMDDERKSITHKFNIGQHEGYVTAGMYGDGTLGEIFLSGIGKQGSTLRGMMDAWSVAVSMGLQYGVPLKVLADKFAHIRFEPEGFTSNPEIRIAHSIPDYIMKWLISKFGDDEDKKELGIINQDIKTSDYTRDFTKEEAKLMVSNKMCVCGAIMMRSGTCYSCSSCGSTTGCG